MRDRMRQARVARLATVSADGRPHLVPVCFVLAADVVYTAVDGKPKRSRNLRRTANIMATGVASLLVDDYTEDWARLWWVRADAVARVVDDPAVQRSAIEALSDKYPQYVERPPPGPVIALDVTRWTGWAADERG